MTEIDQERGQEIEWVKVSPSFGSSYPFGCCNAVLPGRAVCGYPRRVDGTCRNGHPAEAHDE